MLLSFTAAAAFGFAELPFAAGDLRPHGGHVGLFGCVEKDCKDFIEKDFIAKVTHNKHLYTFQNENFINTFGVLGVSPSCHLQQVT